MDITRLPIGIGAEAQVEITFDTIVNPSESAVSGRRAPRLIPIRNYTVTISPDDAEEMQAICLAHLGSRYPFALRDYTSFTFQDEVLAWTAETDSTRAPLRKLFAPSTGSRSFHQRILVPDTSETQIAIEINGAAPTTGITVSIEDPGILVLDTVLAPGDVLTASGQYLVPVCLVDTITSTVHSGPDATGQVLFSYQDVRLREIPEAELTDLLSL